MICTSCNKIFCQTCKLEHNKSHQFINYEEKNYICKHHYRYYDSYCQSCKQNICIACYQGHLDHEIKSYGYMIPEISKLSEKLNKLEDTINDFKKNIDEIINKLNKVKDNMEIYLKLEKDFICNFNIKYINYEILHNLKKSTNKTIINELDAINKVNNINNKFQNIIEIYEKMTNKDKNIINNNDEIVNNKNPHHLFNLNISGIKFDTGINNSNFFKVVYNLITTNHFKL